MSDGLYSNLEEDQGLRSIYALRGQANEAEHKLMRLYRLVKEGESEPDRLLAGRIAELRPEREPAQAALATIETFPPKQRALDAQKVENFAAMMRENITSGPMSFRRAYLRSIIDVTEVGEEIIRVIGAPRAIEAEITEAIPLRGFVRSFVRNWRAQGESNPCFRRERATS